MLLGVQGEREEIRWGEGTRMETQRESIAFIMYVIGTGRSIDGLIDRILDVLSLRQAGIPQKSLVLAGLWAERFSKYCPSIRRFNRVMFSSDEIHRSPLTG